MLYTVAVLTNVAVAIFLLVRAQAASREHATSYLGMSSWQAALVMRASGVLGLVVAVGLVLGARP
jgi:hypothetical protein